MVTASYVLYKMAESHMSLIGQPSVLAQYMLPTKRDVVSYGVYLTNARRKAIVSELYGELSDMCQRSPIKQFQEWDMIRKNKNGSRVFIRRQTFALYFR